MPTAEELLRTLQRQRPQNEVVVPNSTLIKPAGDLGKKLLLPEGHPFVDRVGVVTRLGESWAFQAQDDPPILLKLLPNSVLEMVVRTGEGAGEPVVFKVAGEMTVFDDENFLFLRSALRASGELVNSARNEAPPAASPEKPKPEPTPAAAPSSAEDVLARMQTLEPAAAIVPAPRDSQGAADSATPERRRGMVAGRGLLMDGTFLANRPGRVVKQGGWWTLIPESSRGGAGDVPLRILPSMGLETMSRATTQASYGLVYNVSGEVTMFEGENFLLPRSVVRRADFGNLHP